MYAAGYSTSPPLTNNPFIPDGGAHPSSRFPDISTPPMTNGMNMQQQFVSWGGPSVTPQQQGIYQQYPQQQQQPQMTMGYPPQQQQQQQPQMANTGYLSPTSQGYGSQLQGAFQPSSQFGQQQQQQQQLSAPATVSGSSYAYLQQQGQPPPPGNLNAYNPAQQQLQNNPGYIAQFDPYSSLGQIFNDGSSGQHQQQQQQQQGGYGTSAPASGMMQSMSTGSTSTSTSTSGTSSTSSTYGVSPTGDPHPRDYIRTHKAEIERWDAYAWKQFLNAFEALTKAWEARKGELASKIAVLGAQMQMGVAGMGMGMGMGMAAQYDGGYYVAQIQQEGGRLQGLQKEAENNYDSVAASMFQMREVFGGYRQSSDMASKSRVREATNAALQGLPGWPQPY